MHKRSKYISLIAMSATPLLLTSCSDKPSIDQANVVFSSVAECVVATQAIDNNAATSCQQAFDSTMAAAQNTAPKYLTYSECQKEFTDCKMTTNKEGIVTQEESNVIAATSHVVMPMVAGFVLASAFNRMSSPNTPTMGFSGNNPSEQALYRQRNGSLTHITRSPDGKVIKTPSIMSRFNASVFGKNCNPNQPNTNCSSRSSSSGGGGGSSGFNNRSSRSSRFGS